jgi:phosphoglycolate phosphatase
MQIVSSKKTLLLWDIDGTLVVSGGAGARALTVALQHAFGIDGTLEDIDFAGRTDRWILRQIFHKFSLSATEENFTRYLEAYLLALPAALVNPHSQVLPGVRALLAAAGSSDFTHALLTGNVRRGAQAKLTHHGLWEHFPFGAFGDDAELRNELGPHALRRAREHAGIDWDLARVWIIGDTAHDIACARAFGARVLAVATGGHTLDALATNRPDALVPDLTDTPALLRLLKS